LYNLKQTIILIFNAFQNPEASYDGTKRKTVKKGFLG
jgi:hypothetical protein